MTDIEQKALEMISAARKEHPTPDNYLIARTALCRAIEQHEAFRQEVSDVVWDYYGGKHIPRTSMFAKFAIPKPDPLAEALEAMKDGRAGPTTKSYAACLRAALDALGFEIREKDDG